MENRSVTAGFDATAAVVRQVGAICLDAPDLQAISRRGAGLSRSAVRRRLATVGARTQVGKIRGSPEIGICRFC